MRLVKPATEHILELLSWLESAEQTRQWAGPSVDYPSCSEALAQQLDIENISSFFLVSDDVISTIPLPSCQTLLGFGQYYLRSDRCHLARLIVSPEHRGKGLVQHLIRNLIAQGGRELGVSDYSLFVYTDNIAAINAYEKFGFSHVKKPDGREIDSCIYMSASL